MNVPSRHRADGARDECIARTALSSERTTVGTHVIRLWLVYLLALALGFVNVFDNPARRQVRQGLAYVRRTPELLIPLVMIAVVGTLA